MGIIYENIVAKYFVFAFSNLSKNSNILLENEGASCILMLNIVLHNISDILYTRVFK